MQEKLVYEYAFVRYVPRVEREEFVNVGVMLLCKRKGYLGAKFHIDENRLKAFSPHTDIEELTSYLGSWEWICEGNPAGGPIAKLDPPARFRWLSAVKSTIIQSSKVHPGLCAHPEDVLQKLFNEFVI